MKNLLLALTAIVLSVLFVFSCDKEEVAAVKFDFQKTLYADGSTGRRDNQSNARADDIRRIIVRIYGGRPKTKPNCTGFGVCGTKWFFCELNGVQVPCSSTNSYNQPGVFEGSPIYDPVTNKYYLEILFTESVEGVPSEDLIFKVDQDWVLDTGSRFGFNLTILEGDYNYDNSLGEFGGIRIDFE